MATKRMKLMLGALPLFLLTLNVACGQRTSPDAVARAYVESLTGGSLTAFWSYDSRYNLEVRSAVENLPKPIWGERTQALRREWTNRIRRDRDPKQQFAGGCWQIFRPGAVASVLETRANTQGDDVVSWKVFVKVTFPSESEAPIFFHESRLRRIRGGIVVTDIAKVGPPDPGLRVSGSCQIISEGLSVWPVPPLEKERALELFKAATPDGEQPRVTLKARWGISFGDGLGGVRQADVARAQRLKAILVKYGVNLLNPHQDGTSYFVDGMTPPTDWSRYSLRSQWLDFGRDPLPTYALSESVDFALLSLQPTRDDEATGSFRITYNGCTPICTMLKEVYKAGGYSDIFVEDPMPELLNGKNKQAYFSWDIFEGWKLKGAATLADMAPQKQSTQMVTTAIPIPGVQVSYVHFFEAPPGQPPEKSQRVYRSSFESQSTRAVYWEVGLTHPAPGERIDFRIEARWYKPDGSQMAQQMVDRYVLPGWSNSYHNLGWGWAAAGHWAPGSYRVDLYVQSTRVASGTFRIE